MDEVILYLWNLKGIDLLFLNSIMCLFLCVYCLLNVRTYNKILDSKKKSKYNYFYFVFFGSIFAIISFMFLDTGIAFILAYFIIFLICKYLYKINWLQDIFFTNDFIMILLLSGGITPAAFSIITKVPMNSVDSGVVVVETIAAFMLAALIVYIFNMKLISYGEWTRFTKSNNLIRKLVFLQILIIIMMMFTISVYNQDLNLIVSYYQFFGLIIITIAYRLLIIYTVKSSAAEIYRIRSEIIAEQLENQISLYKNQLKYDKEISKFRHDFNSLMLVLNQLLQENKYDEIKTIIEQTSLAGKEYLDMNQKFSNNIFLQAILSNTYQYSLRNEIKYNATVAYPEGLEIDELDLCRIFSNLINNAMDACNKINIEKRFISITSNNNNSWFTLIVMNSFNGEINETQGTLYSTKENKEEHGFGLKIIEETLEKYGGFLDYSWTDLEFTIKIHIPINMKS